MLNFKYCNSLTKYSRFKTRVVNIGNIPLGGSNPIRIQSMVNTNTMDTDSTVKQIIELIRSGCEYVRITAQSIREAENLLNIKNALEKKGYYVPLIADVHFNPEIAETAARIVEKVRINPGNYGITKDSRIKYSKAEYDIELEKIYSNLSRLVKICKDNGTALRIGSNHGSLSGRILNRYGDTPSGMVESAMEFVRMCEDMKFYDIVLSMKASDIQTMVQAYRLLVNKMIIENMNYPIHLGVTEAGDDISGKIKSAAGIGTLLEDGIGDTIRVSLTGEPRQEIPVAKALVSRYSGRNSHIYIDNVSKIPVNPFEYKKRKTYKIRDIGGNNKPVVITDFSNIGVSSDYTYTGKKKITAKQKNTFPLFSSVKEYIAVNRKSSVLNFVEVNIGELTDTLLKKIKDDKTIVFVFNTDNSHGMAEQRRMFFSLMNNKIDTPVIIHRDYKGLTAEQLYLYSSTDISGLLVDGLGDGIWISADKKFNIKNISQLSFDILQTTGKRITGTEYISCPTCGRAQYDVKKTVEEVRKKTQHLKGLKLAVMGCIVNGPGEMADADYGYVGSGKGKITLYKGKKIIRKNINEKDAVCMLINLIKENGDWRD